MPTNTHSIIVFDETIVDLALESGQISAEACIAKLEPVLEIASGTVHFCIDASELAYRLMPIASIESIIRVVETRSKQGLDTNLLVNVGSIQGWYGIIGLQALRIAREQALAKGKDPSDRRRQIAITKLLLGTNKFTEDLLFGLQDRFDDGELKGWLEFRAYAGISGNDFISIGIGTSSRSDRKIRIISKSDREVAPFSTIATVVLDSTPHAEQEDRCFLKRFFGAPPNPTPIHVPELAESIVDAAREVEKHFGPTYWGTSDDSAQGKVSESILRDINDIY